MPWAAAMPSRFRYSAAATKSSNVLLVREPPGIVPRFAIFPAAAQIGDGVGPACFHPCEDGRRIIRDHADAVAAIAVKDRRYRRLNICEAHDEHRNARAVFRLVEVLFDGDAAEINRDLGLGPDFELSAGNIVAVDRHWRVVTGEDEEGLVVVWTSVKTARAANARKFDCSIGFAVGHVLVDLGLGMDEIGDDKPSTEEGGIVQRSVVSLLDEIDDAQLGRGEVESDDLATLGPMVRHQEEPGLLIAGHEPVMPLSLDDRARRPRRVA